MIASWGKTRPAIEVPCTIEIEHTRESLHAHVALDGDISIGPGDQVLVLGEPIRAPFGERMIVRRRATIVRASPVERLLTRFAAYLELTELYEVGFSAGRHS